MTDLHTCDRHCWIQPRSLPDPPWVLPRLARAMPGQSTVVNPDPARSNRQGDQFNQFSTTATHTAALGTGTGAQNAGQDLPAPCSWNLSTGLRGDHPNSTAKGAPSPDHSSQAAPTQLHLQQDHSVLPRGLSSLLPQLAELLSPREMGQGWAAFVSSQLFQPGNAAADPEAKPIPEQVVPCPDTFPAGLQLCLGAETHLLGEQTWGWLLLQGSPRYRRWYGKSHHNNLFSRRGLIPVAGSCARMQMPGSTGQSHHQQLPLAAHTAQQLPAGTDSRHSCLEDLGEHVTFQSRKISGTIPG